MDNIQRIHFIGIGGIGMSALARLFLHDGKEVGGSDIEETENTKKLIEEGATVVYEQTAENIESKGSDPYDLVVYTEAMPSDHPELVAARNAKIKTINYFEALGMVSNEYYLIAVAGTHGKTTTTAMLTDVIEDAGLDPSVIVGSLRSRTKSNFRAGKSKYMVVEACEYKRDFLHLTPDILVITNIEADHLDYYKDLADVQDAFKTFVLQIREGGYVVANMSNKNVPAVIEGCEATIIDYGKSIDSTLQLVAPGMHNFMNAGAVLSVADILNIEEGKAKESLEHFNGTWRRFEYKGEFNGVPVYDDYAHHPTEVRVTIVGAREKYPGKKIIVVFQPHMYSRTKELFDDFVRELGKSDRILIAPIYAAREKNETGVTHHQLAEKISETNHNVQAFDSFDDIVNDLKETVSEGDVLLVLGAGDIIKVSELLLNE